VELAEPSRTNSDSAGGDRLTGAPSVASSLEHLIAGSQSVITKRIDLALLEARELLSRTAQGAVLAIVGIVLAVAAWFAGAASVVLLVIPDASWVVRLAAFGLLNGICALGLVTLAMQRGRRQTRVRPNDNGSNAPA
jgi:uncharacterized membrane protein YqjE